ncbi:MAG: glutamate-1-semialdehyde 2,1-aminomutase [Cytophagaceae bacterium]|jgi:glutamate-1-semialdehyde 2,1-aminomutase|nr:glutamate-1-semialdehyde 2,1-aminomutase [Cytophagaceae bacterium]
MIHNTSKALFERAQKVIPGGVNSPVRAFRAVGGEPIFIQRAIGAYLFDEDDNAYIDFINSWGPMILGHAYEPIEASIVAAVQHSTSFGAPTRKEIEMAECILSMLPNMEMVRMVNSGTEATMAAIRVARGYTGKEKIIKFEGCYHGHGDSFLIAAGSGAVTMGFPDSPGVTQGVANDTLTAPYNDLAAVESIVAANKGTIAAIILEPVVGNMGCVLPDIEFLKGLRTLCDREGIVYIWDEVMTGFRLSTSGAQGIYPVVPDLTTLGKIIGGGLPVGAYGGKKEIMQCVAPAGPVYQAGTLSGNPIAMSAGLTMLTYLKQHPEVYTRIQSTTASIVKGMEAIHQKLGVSYTINSIGSMYTLFFTSEPVTNFESAKKSDTVLFGKYFRSMLSQGIYLAPSQYESLFVSTAITEEHITQYLQAHENALNDIHT